MVASLTVYKKFIEFGFFGGIILLHLRDDNDVETAEGQPTDGTAHVTAGSSDEESRITGSWKSLRDQLSKNPVTKWINCWLRLANK